MNYHKGYHEKQNPNESSLKSFQADLSKSKENYKNQANSLEQLIITANRVMQKSQDNLKVEPVSITFKKPKHDKFTNSQSQ